MTGTFEIKTQTNNSTYEYKDKDVTIIIQGSFAKDIKTGNTISIQGQCYRADENGNPGQFFGNFNGFARDGEEIRYSMSEMSRQDANKVWDAIDEIEPLVNGEDENE